MFEDTEYKNAMQKQVEHFREEMKKVRTGRAHPDMLSNVQVEAYGQMMPLNQVANVTVSGGTMLLVTPFDPSMIQAIDAAIRNDRNMNLNPSDDGHIVRVPIPPLTEERRKEIVKATSSQVENAKVSIRNVREDARKALKKTELPEDATKKAEKSIDELTRKFSDEIDVIFKEKTAEIMTV